MLTGVGQHPKVAALAVALSVLALLVPRAACAQGGAVPTATSGAAAARLGTAPLRVWHRTRGYGEETSETALGTHWVLPAWGGQVFVDGQLRAGLSDHDLSTNMGLGYRWMSEGANGHPRILGASIWYDGEDTNLDNWINQIGVSFERLGPSLDMRLNANIPLEDLQVSDQSAFGTPLYRDNVLAVNQTNGGDVPLRVVDFEMAPRLFDLNVWVYGGGYQMDGEDVSELGAKAGVRGYVVNDVVVDVGLTDDDLFGTTTTFQVIWTPGRTAPGCSDWSHRLADRMREQVYRNMYVATRQISVESTPALTYPTSGDAVRVVHVDSAAAAGGDGTFEAPLNSLADVQANSQPGDIVLVHGGSSFTGDAVVMQDGQRLLGEGGGELHSVVTQELLEINLPETSTGAHAAAVPVIANAPGDAITLDAGNNLRYSQQTLEISNLEIDGGARGIATVNGIGDIDVNRVSVSNTTGHGMELTPLDEMLNSGTTRGRMFVFVDEVVFDNVGGDDVHIDGTSAEATQLGAIRVGNYASTNGNGTGIALVNPQRQSLVGNIDWDGGTTGVGMLLVQDATDASPVTMTGTNTITGGTSATPDTAGYGIRFENSAGQHNVNGTTITDTGGDSIQFAGGTAFMDFVGRIEQANDASVVSVSNHSIGILNFDELTLGVGVISATNGDGIQLSNADGSYQFNDHVELNGGDAGVDVVNDSGGVVILADAAITNPTGTAVRVDSSLPSFSYTGSITTNTSRPVELTNNTGGGFAYTDGGTAGILSTGQGILVQGNSGGDNRFLGAVDMQTGSADAVQITGNTDGLTQFEELDILTGDGKGFTATNNGDHTVAVVNNGNTIETGTGVGLELNDVTVASEGIRFDSVSVDGATNGITADRVRTGAVIIGAQGSTAGDGGAIQNTTGDGVVISKTTQISLNNMTITGTGGSGVNYAVDANAGSRLILTGNAISDATDATVALRTSAAAAEANINVTGNTIDNSNNLEAIVATFSGASGNTVNLLMQDNTLTNNSGSAATVDIAVGDDTTLNATVGGSAAADGNTITNNSGATGQPFVMDTGSATATARLNLNNNTGVGSTADAFVLTETAGTFTVEDLANVDANNTGGVSVGAGIANDPGGIPTP